MVKSIKNLKDQTGDRITRRPRHRVIIDTDDPKYHPASAAQVGEVKKLLEMITSNVQIAMPEMLPELLEPKEARREGDLANEELKAKFDQLATQWKDETQFASTVLEMATHPAYQQIIGMGQTALPFILHSLAAKIDHWFWALKAITGEDPVGKKSRGNINEMTQAWLDWGRAKGYGC